MSSSAASRSSAGSGKPPGGRPRVTAEAHAPELALHFAAAGHFVDPAALVRSCRAAGEQALASHAGERALEHFDRAIEASSRKAEDPGTTELRLGRARALLNVGRPSEAVVCAHGVFRTYRERGDTARALGIFETFATTSTPEAAELLEEALALTERGTIERARVLRMYSFVLIFVGNDERKGMDMLREALDIVRQHGSTALESSVLHALVYTTWYHLRIEEFRSHTQALIELAENLSDAHQSVWARELMVGLLSYEGRLDEARRMVSAMHQAATRSGLPGDSRIACRQDAHLARLAGEWQRAREMAEPLLHGDPLGAAGPGNVLPILIDAEYLTGRFAAGKAHLANLLRYAAGPGKGNTLVEKNAATYTGRAAYLSGDLRGLEQARSLARELLARPLNPGLQGGVLAGLAHMSLAENDGRAAVECCDRLTGNAKLMCEYAYPGLLGAVARCAGRFDDAVACLEQARSSVAGRRPSLAWICFELGEALLGRRLPGDLGRAREAWKEALGLAHGMGMPPLERKVEERLSRLATNCGPRLPAGLSPRELEVVRLVALGKTNKEIAFDLRISQKTVQSHLAGIFTKIGAANRAEAAVFAARNDLI